tara:strand:+ start:7189 stop:8448 length:1260 start_codon:yes stop_codon:yes gene_type:complete
MHYITSEGLLMKSFTSSTIEQKNMHMRHIEDKVLYGGVNGTRQAIFALRDMRDLLSGVKEGNVSVKWDGSPAIFAGIDPSDNRFFVAKKSIFNKEPKVYKSANDINADTTGDLNVKFQDALKYLPELGIKGVVQGDFLYSKNDLSTKTIHGKKYITFHPNTILYAVDADSDAAKNVLNSKIGIVWHTSYVGDRFENMKAVYDVDVSGFKTSKNVWSQDALLRGVTHITMSEKDTNDVNQNLSEIGRLFNSISSSTLKYLEGNKSLAQSIETFNNTYVRKGESVDDTRQHVDNLIDWHKMRFQKEIDKRKSDKGKISQAEKRDELLKFFSSKNKTNLKKMFDLQKLIIVVKLKLINNLNSMKQIDTFIQTKDGFKVTGEEGYVAIDKLGGEAVKLVDRMEFSYNNFSSDVVKGWDKTGRK